MSRESNPAGNDFFQAALNVWSQVEYARSALEQEKKGLEPVPLVTRLFPHEDQYAQQAGLADIEGFQRFIQASAEEVGCSVKIDHQVITNNDGMNFLRLRVMDQYRLFVYRGEKIRDSQSFTKALQKMKSEVDLHELFYPANSALKRSVSGFAWFVTEVKSNLQKGIQARLSATT